MFMTTTDHIGWEAQGDGRWYYGLNIENGRIADTPSQTAEDGAPARFARNSRPEFA